MKVNDFYRPKLHYTAEKGWINDPNGFSMYNGKYHLFAQHYPHDTKWGPMHWSHAVSDDFVTWEHKSIALTPAKDYEMDLGCFSGTAIEHEGKHVLMYTACGGNNEKGMNQVQCLAFGDGEHYEKYENNPVIDGKLLPDFVTTQDFRDPKVFKEGECFYCLLGAKIPDKNIGTMLLYKSENLIDWTYVGETLRGEEDGALGIMFECPDIFKIGDKYLILTSPMSVPPKGYRYKNFDSSLYFVGDMDFETGKFSIDYYDEIDIGFDFYAPQTMENEKGERVLIAWAQMWERNFVTDELSHGFAGSMTLPRKLELVNNKLIQTPIKTLDNYHKNSYKDIKEGCQNIFRIKAEFDVEKGNEVNFKLLKTNSGYFEVKFDNNRLIINRSKSLFKLDKHPSEDGVNNERYIEFGEKLEKLTLDIIVDKSMVEIFVNDGQFALSSNYYLGKGDVTNEFTTDCVTSFVKYDLI